MGQRHGQTCPALRAGGAGSSGQAELLVQPVGQANSVPASQVVVIPVHQLAVCNDAALPARADDLVERGNPRRWWQRPANQAMRASDSTAARTAATLLSMLGRRAHGPLSAV